MDFALPEIGEGVYEAELIAWQVKPGSSVKRGQNLLEVMTDKATMEVPAPFIGTITTLLAEPGQRLKVGDVILRYEPAGAPVPASAGEERGGPAMEKSPVPPPSLASASAPVSRNGPSPAALGHLPVKAAPSVRLLARKLGVDLGSIHGSGPEGRILLEDVTRRVEPADARAKTAKPAPLEDYGKPGTRIRLQGLRRRIAEHMAHAMRTIPHYSYVDECDATELVRLREELRETFAQVGIKLTYLPFFVRAVVAALKEIPLVNASLDEAAGEIVLHDRYHIGIAVATPGGLIVPVIHDADKKDLPTIAREIETLSSAVRAGKARREDLVGSTFTITSVGNIGGLFSTPVINHPEVGILGIGRIVKRPVFDANGQIRPADLVYLSLSFDHRVVDGAVGAAFTNALLRRLQAPASLLLPPLNV